MGAATVGTWNQTDVRSDHHAVTAKGALRFAVFEGTTTAASFTEFVASISGRLRLFRLPGYSPELNPDEWVWKNVKGVTSKDDLKAKAAGALRRLQEQPRLVRGFFADPHLRYITASAA